MAPWDQRQAHAKMFRTRRTWRPINRYMRPIFPKDHALSSFFNKSGGSLPSLPRQPPAQAVQKCEHVSYGRKPEIVYYCGKDNDPSLTHILSSRLSYDFLKLSWKVCNTAPWPKTFWPRWSIHLLYIYIPVSVNPRSELKTSKVALKSYTVNTYIKRERERVERDGARARASTVLRECWAE